MSKTRRSVGRDLLELGTLSPDYLVNFDLSLGRSLVRRKRIMRSIIVANKATKIIANVASRF